MDEEYLWYAGLGSNQCDHDLVETNRIDQLVKSDRDGTISDTEVLGDISYEEDVNDIDTLQEIDLLSEEGEKPLMC